MANFLNDLPEYIKELAEKGNIKSPRDVMTSSKETLLSFIGNEEDVQILKTAAAKILAQNFVTASDLLRLPYALKWSKISFGCAALDKCTRGGLVTRGITEICGESGSGKTQILLQLSLMVQLPPERGGLRKAVAFICTEDVFPSKRLYEISEHFAAQYPKDEIKFLSNIYIEHVLESDDLLECITMRLAKLMESANIGLIIIDSVAAIFRIKSNYIERAKEMRKLANSLLLYSEKYNCAVVCVNQVTTVDNENRSVPCLGLAWAHLGRTRIKISKVPKHVMVDKQLITVRKFELMYSPESPNEIAEFIITKRGVCDVNKFT